MLRTPLEASWATRDRTLLTTGVLDAVMHSLADNGKRRETPELDVRYKPADWTFANRDN